MSRTGLDAATLANSLRARAGDGSIEWVSEPIQASVLLDIADMLEDYESVQGESDYWMHEALRRICTEGELLRVRTARRKERSENTKLVKIIERIVDDYMCCADTCHALFHAMHRGERSVYRPECTTILARIGETYDGIKIRKYLDQMKELGHEL